MFPIIYFYYTQPQKFLITLITRQQTIVIWKYIKIIFQSLKLQKLTQ